MSGGQTHTSQSSNPTINFTPNSSGGGVISIGGSVGAGNTDFGGSSSASGPSTSVGLDLNMGGMKLQNLADSYLGSYDAYGDTAFVGGGEGTHRIDNMRGNVGSTTTFSQLQNLADSYLGSYDAFGNTAFVGGGAGTHRIDNMRANVGSTTTFSQL